MAFFDCLDSWLLLGGAVYGAVAVNQGWAVNADSFSIREKTSYYL